LRRMETAISSSWGRRWSTSSLQVRDMIAAMKI
jgi:hypothetical protein